MKHLKIMIAIITILICVISVFGYISKTKHNNEHFASKPIFVDKEYMKKVVYSDPFFQRMTYSDLSAMNSLNQDYREVYSSNITEFTNDEKNYITNMVTQIETLDIYKLLPGFDAIPWKFAKINNTIENGFPHTLESVIIFTNLNVTSNINTYIHEQVHVYQRLFPKETDLFVANMGYKRHCSRFDDIIELPRNNPDIDNNIYKYNLDGYFYMRYNNTTPSSLEDSYIKSVGGNTSSSYEHPFEAMAEFVSKKFSSYR